MLLVMSRKAVTGNHPLGPQGCVKCWSGDTRDVRTSPSQGEAFMILTVDISGTRMWSFLILFIITAGAHQICFYHHTDLPLERACYPVRPFVCTPRATYKRQTACGVLGVQRVRSWRSSV